MLAATANMVGSQHIPCGTSPMSSAPLSSAPYSHLSSASGPAGSTTSLMSLMQTQPVFPTGSSHLVSPTASFVQVRPQSATGSSVVRQLSSPQLSPTGSFSMRQVPASPAQSSVMRQFSSPQLSPQTSTHGSRLAPPGSSVMRQSSSSSLLPGTAVIRQASAPLIGSQKLDWLVSRPQQSPQANEAAFSLMQTMVIVAAPSHPSVMQQSQSFLNVPSAMTVSAASAHSISPTTSIRISTLQEVQQREHSPKQEALQPTQKLEHPSAGGACASGDSTTAPEQEAAMSFRSLGSAHSARWSMNSAANMQGVARCAVCHALLNVFAGRARVQAFAAASSLPRPSSALVERLLALQLTECDHAAIAGTLCRFHSLHKSRFELWTQTHMKVRRFAAGTAGLMPQALAKVAERGTDLAQMETLVEQAGPAYIETITQYVKQLQQDVRDNICATLSAKAQDFVETCQMSVNEVDDEINRKLDERKSEMSVDLGRVEDEAREFYWRNQRRLMRLKSSTAAGESRNLQTWKRGGYTERLKEMAAAAQASDSLRSQAAQSHVALKVERERAQKERKLDVWLSKMEQLRQLQHEQADRDQARIFTRVDKTLKKWDEEQIIELRQVLGRFHQHVNRVKKHGLEKIRRGQSVLLNSSPDSSVNSRGDGRQAEFEPFASTLVRSELVAAGSGDRGAGKSLSAEAIEDEVAGGTGTASTLTVEISVFAEFLGSCFPSLRTAFASIDLTGSGRIACFELQTWILLHSYHGEARLIFKGLDENGSGDVGLDNFRMLATPFVHGGLRCGRPAGTISATILVHLFSMCRGSEGFIAALRCCRRILAFVSAGVACDLNASAIEMLESTETSPGQMHSSSSSALPPSPGKSTAASRASAREKEKEESRTDIGRWAKQTVGTDVLDRRPLKCGVPKKQLALSTLAMPRKSSSTPPRSRSTSRSGREGADSWTANLRQHDHFDSGTSSALGSHRSRRGAPPPRASREESSRARDSSRSASPSGRSASATRRRPSVLSVESMSDRNLEGGPPSPALSASPAGRCNLRSLSADFRAHSSGRAAGGGSPIGEGPTRIRERRAASRSQSRERQSSGAGRRGVAASKSPPPLLTNSRVTVVPAAVVERALVERVAQTSGPQALVQAVRAAPVPLTILETQALGVTQVIAPALAPELGVSMMLGSADGWHSRPATPSSVTGVRPITPLMAGARPTSVNGVAHFIQLSGSADGRHSRPTTPSAPQRIMSGGILQTLITPEVASGGSIRSSTPTSRAAPPPLQLSMMSRPFAGRP